MRTEDQMATIITRAMKDLHRDLARKWGFPVSVFAGATCGLGVTLMHESGYSAEQTTEFVQQLLESLAPPAGRGDA